MRLQTGPLSLVAGALLAFSTLIPATAAHAVATHDVATETELRAAVAAAADGDVIRLTGDIGTEAQRIEFLQLETGGALDLNGQTLYSSAVKLAPGTEFTIEDTSASARGLLDAEIATGAEITAGWGAAAIDTTEAHVTIASGNVNAHALAAALGIGGAQGRGDTPGGVTITGGAVTASAVDGAAIGTQGIDEGPAPFFIEINGGTVDARATSGAGIGSAVYLFPTRAPAINITGGNITARSVAGAGIGGASRIGNYYGQTISNIVIEGSAVVDARSEEGAGIGAGANGTAQSLFIGAGAVVTAFSGNAKGPAVGSGAPQLDDGPLTVNGTLIIPAGTFVRSLVADPVGSVVNTIGETGLISGEGELRAKGVWNNHGSITLPEANTLKATDINVNHFHVKLHGNNSGVSDADVRVLAPTFALGDRMLPTPVSPTGWVFAGWNTNADGSGTEFDETTVMTPIVPEVSGIDGTAVDLYAQWAPVSIEVQATPASLIAGESFTLSAECFGIDNVALGDCTAAVTFSSSEASDAIIAQEVAATKAGGRTFAATWGAATGTAKATVNAAETVELELEASAPSVQQGGSLTFVSTGRDEFKNETDVTNDAMLSTDHATDLIDGNRVTFPSASPHAITSTYGALTASVMVEVVPAAVEPGGDDADGGTDDGTDGGTDGGAGGGSAENENGGSSLHQTEAHASPLAQTALAQTGAPSGLLTGLGALLVLAGATLVLVRSRAHRTAHFITK